MFNPLQLMGQQLTQQMQNSVQAMAQQALQRMQAQNPQMYQKFVQMTSGKSESELKSIAENMAKEQGVNLSELAKRIGINI